MTAQDGGPDAIAAAIDAVDQRERQVTMCEVPVTIASTGRPVVLHVPVDLADAEVLELAAFVILGLRPWIQARLDPALAPSPAGRLWTPG